jgi:capsular polysaccharide biosynthesis protein
VTVLADVTRPWLLLAALTAAGAAAAAGYGLTAPKQYEATAQLLVAPVSASDPTFTGLDVFRDTSGKRTAAASVAALLRSPQVVDAVRAKLGLTRGRDSVLSELHVRVLPGSDVVDVTVEDASPTGAAQLANAFADALVAQRTASFQSQLTTAIRRERQLLASLSPAQRKSSVGVELGTRLAALEGLQGQPDPTLRAAAQAEAPTAASWPNVPELVGIGAGFGAALGLVAALALLAFRRLRASSAGGGPAYDRPVSDRVAARLEERLSQRIEALVAEQERLAAREAALAARERDVSAKLDELRAVLPAAPQHDDALAAREAELASRERALAAVAEAARELERREQELEARLAAVAQRERELARRAGQVAVRERELAEAPAPAPAAEAPPPVAEPEPIPEPVSVPQPEPEPLPAAEENGASRWNLVHLERLVQEHGGEYPDRLDEWSAYLFFLRDYAQPDGTVPASFDWLIAETFAELVEA